MWKLLHEWITSATSRTPKGKDWRTLSAWL